mmetsp:Transcript_25976/g.54371  ORF Transcript_25976/g.54371 Transcript_25976/m.54371 type:complete len:107 (-) Transcript_25976:227-547(-)
MQNKLQTTNYNSGTTGTARRPPPFAASYVFPLSLSPNNKFVSFLSKSHGSHPFDSIGCRETFPERLQPNPTCVALRELPMEATLSKSWNGRFLNQSLSCFSSISIA